MPSYAPAPGADARFDAAWESTDQARKASGLDDGHTDEEAREILAERLVKVSGWTLEPGTPEATDNEGEPVVDQEPRSIRVPKLPDVPYWYANPSDAADIEHHITMRRALGGRMPGGLLITGQSGFGKTGGVRYAVKSYNEKFGLDIPFLIMHCPTITDPQKWFGRREIDSKGSHYHKSEFIKAVESGAIILLDELGRLHPHLLNEVMSFLDGSEQVVLSDLNIVVNRHPETVFIATTNIGAAFGGTHRLDWAHRERFGFTIEVGFPPRDEEIKIVALNTGCDLDAAAVLVDVATKSRELWESGDIRAPISTRTIVNAGYLIASGYTEREALARTALPEYDDNADGGVGQESERQKVRGIVTGRKK